MSFILPNLPYSYDALEPHFDAKTMEIHHSKHHNAYTTNLNQAIKETPLAKQSIEEILSQLDMNNAPVRNNAGGYYNHNLFWSILTPNAYEQPIGKLAEAINSEFGSFAQFKEAFTKIAMSQFGSGWAWLCVNQGKLNICSTPNQDNPLMPNGCGGTPILALDVWEHSYYLHYQNRRADYIEAFFKVINWEKVQELYQNAL